jgi:hypothetical protein
MDDASRLANYLTFRGSSLNDRTDTLAHRLTKPGEVDPTKTGITFVDVLFALVVAEALEPLRNWDNFVPNGRWHVTVAVVLTLASWIGYHTSPHRPKYVITFFNWPLAQFLLDIGMVIVYWITVITYEKSRSAAQTAWPEAVLVCIAFALYFLWDLVGWRIKKSDDYPDEKPKAGDWRRRFVTLSGLAVAAIIAFFALRAQQHTWPSYWVFRFDIALIILLVAYRAAKEAVTPVPTALSVSSSSIAVPVTVTLAAGAPVAVTLVAGTHVTIASDPS